MTDISSQLRLMAMNYLARREHGHQELVNKIQRRVPDLDLDQLYPVLDRLAEEGLQDDRRFGEMLARSRAERGYGPMRIRMEMNQTGLANDLIDALLHDMQLDWFALARRQCLKKYGEAAFSDWKSRGKAGQYLQRRGFTSDQVRAALTGDEWE